MTLSYSLLNQTCKPTRFGMEESMATEHGANNIDDARRWATGFMHLTQTDPINYLVTKNGEKHRWVTWSIHHDLARALLLKMHGDFCCGCYWPEFNIWWRNYGFGSSVITAANVDQYLRSYEGFLGFDDLINMSKFLTLTTRYGRGLKRCK